MELVLTGGNFSAQQASEWGLVSRVVEQGGVVDEAVKVASNIAGKGMLAVQAGKEGVNAGASPVANEYYLRIGQLTSTLQRTR